MKSLAIALLIGAASSVRFATGMDDEEVLRIGSNEPDEPVAQPVVRPAAPAAT